MVYIGSGKIERRFVAILAIAAFVIGIGLLASCSSEDRPQQAKTKTYELAGDDTLPALDGDYAYLLAKITAKDPEADSLEAEAVAWEGDEPFRTSTIPAGSTGTISCSELGIFPAGIHEGSLVVVAALDSDASDFSVTASSIEALDLFEERVARWVDS